jgi:hypothetical protein
MPPLFLDIHEISVAVKDVHGAADLFGRVFQSEPEPPSTDTTPGVEATFSTVTVGGHRISLMEDATGSGPTARFIERQGEGVFSILARVSDIEAAMDHMRSSGVRFVEDQPRVFHDQDYAGRTWSRIALAWTHPKSLHGLLVEIQELTE